MITFLSVYAPQFGHNDADKDLFYDQLRAVTAKILKQIGYILFRKRMDKLVSDDTGGGGCSAAQAPACDMHMVIPPILS